MIALLAAAAFGQGVKKDALIGWVKSPTLALSISLVDIRMQTTAADGTTKVIDPLADGALKGMVDAIAGGADVNAVDNDGKSTLWLLINMSLPQSLLPGVVLTPTPDARRDAFIARAASYLIDKGINVNLADKQTKSTALILAIKAGYMDLAQLLISKGADLSPVDKDGFNALRYACLYDDSGAVAAAIIAKGVGLGDAYNGGLNQFRGFTALHFAAYADNLTTVRELVAAGAKIDALDAGKNSALARAAASTFNPDSAYNISEYLLLRGYGMETSGPNSQAFLQKAAADAGNLAAAWLFSPAGLASLNARMKFESVPAIGAGDIDNSTAQPDEKTMKYLVSSLILRSGTFQGKAVAGFRISDLSVVKTGKNGAYRVSFRAYVLYEDDQDQQGVVRTQQGNAQVTYSIRKYSTSIVGSDHYEFRALKDDFDEWYAAQI